MNLKNFLVLSSVAAAALGFSGRAWADLIDPLDTTVNFVSTFGGELVTANGDGTVTLTRTVANQDAGATWSRPGGLLSLTTENLLTVTPVGPVNGGYYNANILLFNATGSYLAESHWLGDNNSTAVQTLDVAQFAANLAQSNPALAAATQYELRFRVDPYGSAGAGFSFDQITATSVPEPATGLLLLGGFPALWAVRRKTVNG